MVELHWRETISSLLVLMNVFVDVLPYLFIFFSFVAFEVLFDEQGRMLT